MLDSARARQVAENGRSRSFRPTICTPNHRSDHPLIRMPIAAASEE
jgi:hypothetical protein